MLQSSTSQSLKTGPDAQRYLASQGIVAAEVVRHRNGVFSASFFIPGLQIGVVPADQWALRIGLLPDIRIINTHDTFAEWRDGKPVIEALVEFMTTWIAPPQQKYIAAPTSIIVAGERRTVTEAVWTQRIPRMPRIVYNAVQQSCKAPAPYISGFCFHIA